MRIVVGITTCSKPYVTPTDTLPSYILVFNVSCVPLFSVLSAAAGRQITASRHTVAIKVFIIVLFT